MKSKIAWGVLCLLVPGTVAAQPRQGSFVPPVPPPKIYKQYVSPPPAPAPYQYSRPSGSSPGSGATSRDRAPPSSRPDPSVKAGSPVPSGPTKTERDEEEMRSVNGIKRAVDSAASPALRAALLLQCAPPRCTPPPVDSSNPERACVSGNCQTGTGVLRFKKGSSPDNINVYGDHARLYEGEFKDGLPDGTGKVFDWRGNLTYTGQVKAGVEDGQGVQIIYFRGKLERSYDGGFRAGKRHGAGVFTRYGSVSGAIEKMYVGDWKDGKKDGKGKEYKGGIFVGAVQETELVYEGEFKDDERHGTGKLFSNGVATAGVWVKGVSAP